MELVNEIAKRVDSIGGAVYLVGGSVRDALLGIENKDIDIEVFGIHNAELRNILSSLGELQEVGKSFGVFKLKGYDVDIAMPRTERQCTGSGHKNFDISINPFMSTADASKRRDITINGLMKNVMTNEIIDHWGGLDDIDKKRIRHINSDTFIEDPLRVFRVAQFASRLNFIVDKDTVKLCSRIDTSTLSKERVFEETSKALLKSAKPSVYFESLREMNQLSTWFNELQDLIGVKQNSNYHKESDAWVHTMMVLDEAATVRDKAEHRLGFMISALCHDLGKAVTVSIDEKGEYHSYKHEDYGVPIAERFVSRLTNRKDTVKYVLNMVKNHMQPNMKADNKSRVKSTNRMFYEGICPNDLILLAKCDESGKIPKVNTGNYEWLLNRLQVYSETMSKPFIQGRDLIQAGIEPSEKFSELLELATKLRLAGIEKEQALKQVLAVAKKGHLI